MSPICNSPLLVAQRGTAFIFLKGMNKLKDDRDQSLFLQTAAAPSIAAAAAAAAIGIAEASPVFGLPPEAAVVVVPAVVLAAVVVVPAVVEVVAAVVAVVSAVVSCAVEKV